jgi:glycosyltransferase involved in cell wall biosynthesis
VSAPRVALNALFLHYPRSGTGRYLDRLVACVGPAADPYLLGSRRFPPADESATSHPAHLLASPFDRRSGALAKVWHEQVAAPAEARAWRADLYHVPHFAPPVVPRSPTVVTVHDLVPVLWPEYRRTAEQRLYTGLVALGLRSAARVITDSRASAADLVRYLRVPPDRIRVIPLGVDERFRPLGSPAERAWAATVWSRYRLVQPYLLCFVGSLDRRKNVDRLIAAYARLKYEHHLPHQLVIVGGRRGSDAIFYDPLPDLVRLGVTESVILIDRVGDDEARALHAGADVFVYPSLYEGFGLPPLEAMACGAPVACSNASSLPEVVGDAGVLFDPTDVLAMAEAVHRIVADRDLRSHLASTARLVAARFTWEATATATLDVYREVA